MCPSPFSQKTSQNKILPPATNTRLTNATMSSAAFDAALSALGSLNSSLVRAMSEFIKTIMGIGTPFNMVVLIVLIGSLCTLIGTIASQLRIFANHRADIHLKRELVERGLSVDEIERVIQAKSPAEKTNC